MFAETKKPYVTIASAIACFIALAISLLGLSIAHAEGGSKRIFGGQFFDAKSSPVALIALIRDGQYYSFCSGTLVAPTLVLTAAHCIVDEQGRGYEFQVVIGGNVFTPSAAYYSANYRPNARVTTSNQKHDIGMVVLQFGVTNVQPMPVWADYDFLSFPQTVAVAGFGMNNEGYFSGGLEQYNLAKIASYQLIATQDEMLLGSFQTFATNPCPGDSGGPVLSDFSYLGQMLYKGILGTTSTAGAYADEYGRCAVYDDRAHFVDLRSPSAVAFLNAFPGVYRISARNAYISKLAIELGSQVSATVWQVNGLRELKKYGAGLLPNAQTLSIFAQDSARKNIIKRINGRLRVVRRSLDAKAAKAAIRAVVRLCDSLAGLGVQ
jgi:V8-like Glu-specific endopeptidase